MFKDIGAYTLRPFMTAIKIYAERQKVKDLLITDMTFRYIFLVGCKNIDKQEGYSIHTKKQLKKILLIMCSKFSRDTAYNTAIKNTLKDLKECGYLEKM